MPSATIADLLVDTLEAAGVARIYGVAGDSLNAITESIRRRDTIDWVHVRHEEVAAFAAGAEAHLTGGLAVCAGSCGPGNLHLINGLFDAMRSRVPVVAIAAQIPSAEIGRSYFQETDPTRLFRDCSVFCELVSSPKQLPGVFESAVRAAIGERGVAVIVLPGDVALESAAGLPKLSAALVPARPVTAPNPAEIDDLATMLDASTRITLLCGRGCWGAHDRVVALADRLKAPIVHALGGKEGIEWDNPFDVGMTGLIGFSSGYHAMKETELLLMLGTDFPYRQFYPTEARIAQIDLRPAHLGRRTPIDLGITADVAASIDALLELVAPKPDRAWLDLCLEHYADARQGLDELAAGTNSKPPIHPQHLARLLSEHASDDAVFTFDVGTPTVWAARYLRMNGRRRLIGSLNHGSMANALAQAIGAQSAYPQRQIIAFCGDGGFSMLMGDLLTLKQHHLPVKVVILDNHTLGFVEMEMKAAGFLDTAVALTDTDYAAMARGAGIQGWRVTEPADLEPTLTTFLAHPGPAVLDVVTARQELALPPKFEAEQIKGFSLYLARAVLDGRGSSVIDLARTNLRRR